MELISLLRKLERAFLKYIEFSLTLSQSDYTIYLLELLSLRQKEGGGPMKVGRPRKGSHVVEAKKSVEEMRLELNKSM